VKILGGVLGLYGGVEGWRGDVVGGGRVVGPSLVGGVRWSGAVRFGGVGGGGMIGICGRGEWTRGVGS